MEEWQAQSYIYCYWEETIPFFIMQIEPEIIRKYGNNIYANPSTDNLWDVPILCDSFWLSKHINTACFVELGGKKPPDNQLPS